jgi:hypothetical protein
LPGCTDIPSTNFASAESGEGPKQSLPTEVQFFNSISGKLEIELTEPPQPMPNVANLGASPTAKIRSLRLLARVDDPPRDQYRSLTVEELGRIIFPKPQIRVQGKAGGLVLHKAPNGQTVYGSRSAVSHRGDRTKDTG